MGLSASLQIGRTGLEAAQVGIEVAGHNLANAATPNFHRQEVHLTARPDQEIQRGIFVGRGVKIDSVRRVIDEALENRIRGSLSDKAANEAAAELLSQVEAVYNELSDIDLSTRLNEFFNAWSQLANQPDEASFRTLLLQEAGNLSSTLRQFKEELTSLRTQTDTQIEQAARNVDDLLERIADVDARIVATERGVKGSAHGLRDQRDQLLAELAEYFDLSTVEHENGSVDVFVGSLPVLNNSTSRGVELLRTTVDGQVQVEVVVRSDQSPITATRGRLGSLIQGRDADVDAAVKTVDAFAAALIEQVNRLHAEGQGLSGYTSITGDTRVLDADATLDSADADLAFAPNHGSFLLHVTQRSTGRTVTTRIDVDLDGVDTANNTTLNRLATQLDAVANVDATVTPDQRLRLDTSAGDFELSFSSDTSGALAALGLNTFFTGRSASDIAVRSDLTPGQVAAALGDNTQANALRLAQLRDTPIAGLGGLSLTQTWSRHVEDYAIRQGQAQASAESSAVVLDNLQNQQQSISGVNIDEETINLLQFSRSYQASARFISVVDEMMQTLLGLV